MASVAVITLGLYPAVLTESLWLLHHKKLVRDLEKIVVVTSAEGAATLRAEEHRLQAMYREWGRHWAGQNLPTLLCETTAAGAKAAGRTVLKAYFDHVRDQCDVYAVAAGQPEMRDWLANAVAMTDRTQHRVLAFDAPRFQGGLDEEKLYQKAEFFYPSLDRAIDPSSHVIAPEPCFVKAADRLTMERKQILAAALIRGDDIRNLLAMIQSAEGYDPIALIEQHNLATAEPDVHVTLAPSTSSAPKILLISQDTHCEITADLKSVTAWLMLLAAAQDDAHKDQDSVDLRAAPAMRCAAERVFAATGEDWPELRKALDDFINAGLCDGYDPDSPVPHALRLLIGKNITQWAQTLSSQVIDALREILCPEIGGKSCVYTPPPFLKRAVTQVNGAMLQDWLKP